MLFIMYVVSILRYTLRNKNQDEVCEELVLMLTDTLNGELSAVGPEDILSQSQLEELQQALAQQVITLLVKSEIVCCSMYSNNI